MGIIGLTTFIDENLHLLRDYQLCDTKVIVDGNNLYHLLFYEYNIDYQHGGDYNKFALKTREFFQLLSSCKISPYVVFDGGYEPGNKKFNTSLERFKKRIEMACSIAHGGRGKALPILAYETFRQILLDIGIPFVMCDFEADNDVAALANDFGCPVISFDSDFYILPLTNGFVPFDTVNFNVQTVTKGSLSYKYLPSRIYHKEELVKFFPNLGLKVLPLIATILGNDYVDKRSFESFYAKVRVPKRRNSKLSIPKTHHRMLKVVTWLEKIDNFDDGVEEIVNSVKPEAQDKLREMINMSIKSFSEVPAMDSSFSLYQYFLGKCQKGSEDLKSVKCFNGSVIPTWFRMSHRNAKLPVNLQNIIVLHRNILACQVENIQEISTYQCSLHLRQIMYGILTKNDNAKCLLEQTSEGDIKTHIQEFDRDIKNLKRNMIKPMLNLEDFGELPGVEEIPDLEVAIRDKLLWQSLGVHAENLANVACDVRFTVCTYIYWINHSEPRVTMNHVRALILCLVYLSMKKFDRNREVNVTDSAVQEASFQKYFQQLTDIQFTSVLENLAQYRHKKEHNKKHPMDISIVHGFSQFQASFLAAIQLNQLLSCPQPCPDPAQIFSGPFLYNTVSELQTSRDPELIISEMLDRESPVYTLYQGLFSGVIQNVKSEMLTSDVINCKSKKRKKKTNVKKVSEMNTGCCNDETTVSNDQVSPDDDELEYLAACNLSNRFVNLLLQNNNK